MKWNDLLCSFVVNISAWWQNVNFFFTFSNSSYISDDDSSCCQHHPYFKHSNINSGHIACSSMKHFPWDLIIVEIPLLTKFAFYALSYWPCFFSTQIYGPNVKHKGPWIEMKKIRSHNLHHWLRKQGFLDVYYISWKLGLAGKNATKSSSPYFIIQTAINQPEQLQNTHPLLYSWSGILWRMRHIYSCAN